MAIWLDNFRRHNSLDVAQAPHTAQVLQAMCHPPPVLGGPVRVFSCKCMRGSPLQLCLTNASRRLQVRTR